uniref:Uncharacterized protein n=1 Tax=Glossina palpalis gambiensis TaxID=67801 RepID=A0A1B0B9H5_9MUSC
MSYTSLLVQNLSNLKDKSCRHRLPVFLLANNLQLRCPNNSSVTVSVNKHLQLSSEDCSQNNTLDWQLLSVRSKVSSEPVLLTFIITKGLCNYHKICKITLHPPLVIEDLSTQIVQMHLLLQALMKVVVLLVIISVIMR